MSDEVSDFLRSVQELKGQRAEEDEARNRELEEKILQERRERQARRAERARSISPQKSSPANTPPPSSQRSSVHVSGKLDLAASPALDSPASFADPNPRAHERSDSLDEAMDPSTSPTKENQSPFDTDAKRASFSLASSSAGVPARTSPLSWQRRPPSQTGRPLSMLAAQNAARSSTTPSDPDMAADQAPSRDQIAQALGSKDPSWFRQTADRGQNSAAYRKNQVEDEDTMDMSGLQSQLPGMSSRTPSAETPADTSGSDAVSPGLHGRLAAPLSITSAQRLDPPGSAAAKEGDETENDKQGLVSPGFGRTSPTRPVSPTKGMGGFVQSAMMKRSDSVKRWSVNSPAGLQRADSVVSNRSNQDSKTTRPDSTQLGSRSRPAAHFRSGSNTPSSRPTSSHARNTESDLQLAVDTGEDDQSMETADNGDDEKTPPTSPSKTMDPRRWSPTKSSWLDKALNKPESPKPKHTPALSNQPAWMVELNKAKAQKAGNPNADLGRAPSAISHKHNVSIGGLMRTPAPGTNVKPSGPDGAASYASSGAASVTANPVALRTGLVRSKTGDSGVGSEDSSALGGTASKPETPAKKDFRANLKPRQPPPGPSGDKDDGNELQNVFGNLRRTKTQNYVAPDELKSNIMRGKAALNATGGPKKTERKDEFKDAILQKKDEFKKAQIEGRGVTRNASSEDDKPIPEGLVKKIELGKSTSLPRRDSATSDSTSASLSARSAAGRSSSIPKQPSGIPAGTANISARSSRADRSSTITSHVSMMPSPSASSRTDPSPERSSFVSKRGSVSSQGVLPTSASSEAVEASNHPKRDSATLRGLASISPLNKETGAPGRLQGKLGGGSLADRFNPALAGLLARGPPGAGSGSSQGSTGTAANTSASNGETSSGPQLTHITKNRARGPRRKAPSAAGPKVAEVGVDRPGSVASASSTPSVSKPATDSPVVSPLSSSMTRGDFEIGDISPMADLFPRPLSPSKRIHDQVAALAAKGQASPTRQNEGAGVDSTSQPPSPRKLDMNRLSRQDQAKGEDASSQPVSPRKLDMKRMSKFLDESSQPSEAGEEKPVEEKPKVSSPPPATRPKPVFDKSPSPTLQRSQPSSPPKPFERPLPEPVRSPHREPSRQQAPRQAISPAPSQPLTPALSSNGTFSAAETVQSSAKLPARPLPRPPSPGPRSPPSNASPTRSPSRPRSPTKDALETTAMLNDIFGKGRPSRDYRVDTAEILVKRPQAGPKIQTHQAQLFQVSGDGKKVPVPAYNERILFEREMYLCPHIFTNDSGKKVTEVYFWAGDEVPQSTVDDASIFVQREARSLGGRLVKLRQGKETSEFFQALGGVVIVRRGSSNKFDSLAPSLLCGRRYLGQVAFDEVDFSPMNLCSGFPYLITQSGKCFLWKGRGSDVDELSCARLIGMDLALMGELEEVEDGDEPANFWDIFNGGSRMHSADHWRLKPNYDKYCGRLFCSEAASSQQILEISPFSQADLQRTGVYVLDAFFEMYIIVGAEAQPQYTSFHNALEFAQEYAILAAGMEDRPFVPISTVVLEGIPRDMKSVFRKWRDNQSPTQMNQNTGLRRGRSLRVLPLTQALQALSE